jgi:hypothetical protein
MQAFSSQTRKGGINSRTALRSMFQKSGKDVHWIHLAANQVQFRALTDAVMKLWILYKVKHFLTA